MRRPVLDQTLGVCSAPRISQTQIMFRGRLSSPDFTPDPESSYVRLFERGEVPWVEIAFPSVGWSLRRWKEIEGLSAFQTFSNLRRRPAD